MIPTGSINDYKMDDQISVLMFFFSKHSQNLLNLGRYLQTDELRRSAGWRAQTEVANYISQRAARVVPVIGKGVGQKPDLGSNHG